MLNLGESIRLGQREMAKVIVEGLRPKARSGFHDTGDDGDTEDEARGWNAPRGGGQKQRSGWENLLSVRIDSSSRWDRSESLASRGSATICGNSSPKPAGRRTPLLRRKLRSSIPTSALAVITDNSGCISLERPVTDGISQLLVSSSMTSLEPTPTTLPRRK